MAFGEDRTVRRRRLQVARLVAAVVVMCAAIVGGFQTSQSWAAGDQPAEAEIIAKVDPSGRLDITQRFTFKDGAPAKISEDIATSVDAVGLDNTNYRYEISDVKASIGGQPMNPDVSTTSTHVTIALATSQTKEPIEITYSVVGAANAVERVTSERHTQVKWPILQGLSFPISQVDGRISTPSAPLAFDCQAGVPGNLLACNAWQAGTFESIDPSFTQISLGAGDSVVLSMRFPTSSVAVNQILQEHWTLDRAFTFSGFPLWIAVAVAAFGICTVGMFQRRGARDEVGTGRPAVIAAFAPVGQDQSEFRLLADIHPGEVGTVADERVDPIDVVATILHLAVRGHLTIVEVPSGSSRATMDWAFERNDCDEPLKDYEQILLDTIAPYSGKQVRVSQLDMAVNQSIPAIQSKIYDECMANGWFHSRPDQVRNFWRVLGWSLLLTSLLTFSLLVFFTTFGLLGMVLIAISIGFLWISQSMPRRTRAGSDLLAGLSLLSNQLATQPTNQLPHGAEYEVLSSVLPYATVLGHRRRWSDAFADADDDPGVPDPDDLSWYRGSAEWNLSDLSQSLDAFITSVIGRLYER